MKKIPGNNDNLPTLTQMQSPIQFEADLCTVRNFTPFHFTGYNDPYNATITYTEQAIRLNLFQPKKLPSVSGGGLVKEYVLEAIEFRWDAEHLVKDKRYPLEVQLIHYAKKYENYDNALNYKDGIAILATFFQVTEMANEAFDSLIQGAAVVEVITDRVIIPRLFLSPKICQYYRYVGSLTTPCFNETVIWTVFSIPSHISDSQLKELTDKWTQLNKPQTTNCRELQNINHRRVYLSAI